MSFALSLFETDTLVLCSSRTRFMVETLNNLKNNKLKKGATSAHGSNESKERISKFVSGIGKRYHG